MSARKPKLTDRIVFYAARLAIGVAARAPQWLGYGFAAGLGRLYFRLSTRRQRCALRFLQAAYPDKPDVELLRLGRIATGNICKVPIDMARLTRLLDRGGDVRDVVETAQFVAEIPKPPFLGATAHFGSWEVGAVTVGTLTGNAHGVARVFKNPLLNDWILHNRRRGGLTIHPRRGGIKPLADALANGAVGLQVVDQHQRMRGVHADFFGRPASCERAVATLAVRRSYPILIACCQRIGPGFRFKMVCQAVLQPVQTGDREADVLATVQKINGALEGMIRRDPEQYLWIHDRYREPVVEE